MKILFTKSYDGTSTERFIRLFFSGLGTTTEVRSWTILVLYSDLFFNVKQMPCLRVKPYYVFNPRLWLL